MTLYLPCVFQCECACPAVVLVSKVGVTATSLSSPSLFLPLSFSFLLSAFLHSKFSGGRQFVFQIVKPHPQFTEIQKETHKLTYLAANS